MSRKYAVAWRAAGAFTEVIKEPKRPKQTTADLGIRPSSFHAPPSNRTEYEPTYEGYHNIRRVLEEATDEEVEFWSKWYYHAQADVRELADKYEPPFITVAAIVAVLSPGNKWAGNLKAAESLLQGVDSINAYPKNIEKAKAMLETWKTDRVTGPKVTVFFQSLLNPPKFQNKLVLDSHAINIWRGVKMDIKSTKEPTDPEREQMLKDYHEVAEDTGIPVQGIQAITWFIWKSLQKPSAPTAQIDQALHGLDSMITAANPAPASPRTRPTTVHEPVADWPEDDQEPELSPYPHSLPHVPSWKREAVSWRAWPKQSRLLREG